MYKLPESTVERLLNKGWSLSRVTQLERCVEASTIVNRAREQSAEERAKRSRTTKITWQKPERRQKQTKALKGRRQGPCSEERRRACSIGQKKRFERPEEREETRLAAIIMHQKHPEHEREHLHKPQVWKKISDTVLRLYKEGRYYKKPNQQEQRLQGILDECFPNEFVYNGDCSLGITLNSMIPDFVNINDKKQVIELFGDYWHRNDNPEERIARYKEVGWDALVIWEHELNDLECLLQKIKGVANAKTNIPQLC